MGYCVVPDALPETQDLRADTCPKPATCIQPLKFEKVMEDSWRGFEVFAIKRRRVAKPERRSEQSL